MSLRDDLLPVADTLRGLPQQFGLRRFAVTLRRRVWPGDEIGSGTPTNQDLVLLPSPRVRYLPPFARQMEAILAAGGKITDRYYRVDKITPYYLDSNGNPGGYTPDQLRLRVGPDLPNVEPVAVLVGDDGIAFECTQVILEIDRAFGYSMILQQTDVSTPHLQSIALDQPAQMRVGKQQQLVARGTFQDASVYPVTPLCVFTSSAPGVATVDLLGNVTAVSAGTTQLTAAMLNNTSAPVTLTVNP